VRVNNALEQILRCKEVLPADEIVQLAQAKKTCCSLIDADMYLEV